jgi:hypothetical protein
VLRDWGSLIVVLEPNRKVHSHNWSKVVFTTACLFLYERLSYT